MARASEQWQRRPPLPSTHYLDTRLYTDETIFAEERDKIFGHVWFIACHESELPRAFDYRTFQHPAGPGLVLIRGKDEQVRAFFNICPHRGNLLVYEPAGSARALTCIFHAWTFDGGKTELFAVGKIYDRARLRDGAARLSSRRIELDTRQLGIGTHIPL
jgi:methanesulfonate monooxygenase large subunit